MQINSLQNTPQYQQNFQGRYWNLITKPSGKRIAPLNMVDEKITIGKTYNKLWEDLKLPLELKPKLIFKKVDPDIAMGFSKSDYTIFVNENIDTFQCHLKNKTGRNKESLRHEIEHVKQTWDVIRLLGAEKCITEDTPELVKRMARNVEKTFGRIGKNSPERERAEKYLRATLNYPNANADDLDPLHFLQPLEYHFNELEIGARNAEKEVRQDLLTKIKRTIFEYVKEYKREQYIQNRLREIRNK